MLRLRLLAEFVFDGTLFGTLYICVINRTSDCIIVRLLQALMMSNEARKTTTVGEIVNLMSVDAQRLQDATGYLWMTWSAPLQICIAIAMLWTLLGASVLSGVAIMIILIPINAVIANKSRKLQVSSLLLFSDMRFLISL